MNFCVRFSGPTCTLLSLVIASFAVSASDLSEHQVLSAVPAIELSKIDSYLNTLMSGVVVKKEFFEIGQTISCVDINHQPSLNHPLIGRTHVVQTEPSQELLAKMPGTWVKSSAHTDCPEGTVDMVLPTRLAIAKAGSVDNFLSINGLKRPANNDQRSSRSANSLDNPPAPELGEPYNRQYAEFHTAYSSFRAIGAQATFKVSKPYVENINEQSIGQVWLSGGSYTALQTIEWGWIVSYRVNNDSSPHFFSFYTANNYNSYCYNDTCGFVRVSPTALHYRNALSVNSEFTAGVVFDPSTKNWVLYQKSDANISNTTGTYTMIGYYPASLFGTGPMSKSAERLQAGGEVYGKVSEQPHTTTQMGNGQRPWTGGGLQPVVLNTSAAYIRNVGYQGLDFSLNYLSSSNTISYVSKAYCYDAYYGFNSSWGAYIYYGGAGYYKWYCD